MKKSITIRNIIFLFRVVLPELQNTFLSDPHRYKFHVRRRVWSEMNLKTFWVNSCWKGCDDNCNHSNNKTLHVQFTKKKKKNLHVQKSINNQENKANYSEIKNMNIGWIFIYQHFGMWKDFPFKLLHQRKVINDEKLVYFDIICNNVRSFWHFVYSQSHILSLAWGFFLLMSM